MCITKCWLSQKHKKKDLRIPTPLLFQHMELIDSIFHSYYISMDFSWQANTLN